MMSCFKEDNMHEDYDLEGELLLAWRLRCSEVLFGSLCFLVGNIYPTSKSNSNGPTCWVWNQEQQVDREVPQSQSAPSPTSKMFRPRPSSVYFISVALAHFYHFHGGKNCVYSADLASG